MAGMARNVDFMLTIQEILDLMFGPVDLGSLSRLSDGSELTRNSE